MEVEDRDQGNVFLAIAKTQWHNGEDGEDLARNLAFAFSAVVREGRSPTSDDEIIEELRRFLGERNV